MKLTLKIGFMRWIYHFASADQAHFCSFKLLIVLCFSSSHYFAIFIVIAMACLCLWLWICRMRTLREKLGRLQVADMHKLRSRWSFTSHVLITIHVWTSGDSQDFLGVADKQCWNILALHSEWSDHHLRLRNNRSDSRLKTFEKYWHSRRSLLWGMMFFFGFHKTEQIPASKMQIKCVKLIRDIPENFQMNLR